MCSEAVQKLFPEYRFYATPKEILANTDEQTRSHVYETIARIEALGDAYRLVQPQTSLGIPDFNVPDPDSWGKAMSVYATKRFGTCAAVYAQKMDDYSERPLSAKVYLSLILDKLAERRIVCSTN